MIKEIRTMIVIITICLTIYSISKVYSPYPEDGDYEACIECEECTMGDSTVSDWVTAEEAINALEY